MDNGSSMAGKCPACGQYQLISYAGCHECLNIECGYGVCD